jgi:hypothetical protein
MSRNASSASKTGKRTSHLPLIAGIVLIVSAMAIAIFAAKPGLESGAPQAAPAAGIGVASNAVAATRAARALQAREPYFEFGPVSMAAGKVKHRYWLRNESTAPVEIRRIYTSCMCTTATFVKGMRVVGTYGMPGHGPLPDVNETLAPNEAAYIDAVFDPAAHGPAGLGHTERVITVEPAAGEPLQVGFAAEVKP